MEKHRKLYFINSSLQGDVHEMIDISMLAIFATIYNCVEVYLLDGRMQVILRGLEKITSKEVFNKVHFFKTHCISKMTTTIGAFIDAWLYIRSERNSICYFSSVNYLSVHIINFLCKILHKDVIICAHSELSLITVPKAHYSHWWAYLVQRFFMKTAISKYLNIMVLGDQILENVKTNMPNRSKYFFAYEHPYFTFNQSSAKRHNWEGQLIKIGVIGSVSESVERGFDNILKFASMLNTVPAIEFRIIGRIPKRLAKMLPANAKIYNDSDRLIPKDEYDELVDELDYIYLPYPIGSFMHTASGAILEALFKNKGIVMHRNAYSTYLAERYGEFGYFIDGLSKDEILSHLCNKSFHAQLIKNGQAVKNALTPLNVLNRFGADYFEKQCQKRK